MIMNSNSILILGCGDIGIRTGALMLAAGGRVAAVRRSPSKLPAGLDGYAADYTVAGSLDFIEDLKPDYVLATFNPAERSPEGYKAGFASAAANLLSGLGAHVPRRILSVSSTRVFAERNGGWVDEDSPLATDDPRALAIVQAERLLLDGPAAATVIRFGGIYGTPGGRLLSRVARGELCAPQPVTYSNRIHREDCAGFLFHLLQMDAAGEPLAPVYVGVDDEPAPQYEVEQWMAGELGVTGASTMAAGRGTSGHKRCRNRLLHASGYSLRFKSYREGYRAVMCAEGAA